MRILSLFDGMACGMIAMQLAGVQVESYDAYEIDKYAVKTAQHNFPIIREHGDVFVADFTQYEGVDFIVGGSPCTYWSIAQTKNRETVASGMGWELFSQYVRALREAKPKYFIYENNKSMSKQIRASIDEAFGFEAVCINSALVSAQNRQRLYWVGRRNEDGTYSKVNVEQPADRGILLKDVLDSAVAMRESTRSYRIGRQDNRREFFTKNQGNMVAEPINVTADGKSQIVKANYHKMSDANFFNGDGGMRFAASGVAEPITDICQVGAMPMPNGELSTSAGFRIYSTEAKGRYLCANGGGAGAKTGLYAEPLQYEELSEEYYKGCADGNLVGMIENEGKYKNGKQPSQQYRVYSCEDKSVCVDADSRKHYIIPYSIEFDEDGNPIKAIGKDGKQITIYEVSNGQITIKGKQYPIKLRDGYYIIRKLTVSECKRLQTVPEWYDFSCVSNSQAYKMLGNGWTCEVIKHLIDSCLNEKATDFDEQCRLF